jgi:peptidoglycan/LPS O-acetylase OafA/YrhL
MDTFKKVLRHGVVEYLGRISYSLYLTHSIVLFAAFDLLFGKLPKSIIYAFVLVGALAFAHVFCVMVEEPCIRLGKRVKSAAAPRSISHNESERIKSLFN